MYWEDTLLEPLSLQISHLLIILAVLRCSVPMYNLISRKQNYNTETSLQYMLVHVSLKNGFYPPPCGQVDKSSLPLLKLKDYHLIGPTYSPKERK